MLFVLSMLLKTPKMELIFIQGGDAMTLEILPILWQGLQFGWALFSSIIIAVVKTAISNPTGFWVLIGIIILNAIIYRIKR